MDAKIKDAEFLGPCENCKGSGESCKECELCFLRLTGEESGRRTEKKCREKYDLLSRLYKMPNYSFFRSVYPGADESSFVPLMRPKSYA